MKLQLLGTLVILATSAFTGVNRPANAASSTYQSSCNNISISGNRLSANCRRNNGRFNRSSLVLQGIENINGNLQLTNFNKASNFQDSCNNIRIQGNVLSANCRSQNGRTNRTSLVLQGIENIDGNLKYSSKSATNSQVSNYQQSCNNIAIAGNVLSANCRRNNGRFNRSSLVLQGIENINGNLQLTNFNKASNFQDSCNNIRIQGNVLSASCRSRNGRNNRTSLVLQGIENINGNLKYSSNSKTDSQVSNYQQSCNNIAIAGNVISANCRRNNGRFNRSSLVLQGIENINGNLRVSNPNRVSNFQESCNDIRIQGNVLSASCRSRNGRSNRTSLVLNGIENINGILQYTSNP